MLEKLSQFFKSNLSIDAQESSPRDDRTLKMATAALLIEVSRADYNMSQEEKESIINTLRDIFDLTSQELDALIEMAEQQVKQSTSLFQFTHLLNDSYDYEQKLSLIRSMWLVAYADDNLDRYEEHIIRKVAELIHVEHADFIQLKQSARAAQAGE